MSDNLKNKELWIVGSGPMAMDHARVALHLGYRPVVIGRGESSAKRFEKEVNVPVVLGGLAGFLKSTKPSKNTYIIIATGTESLMTTLLQFVDLEFAGILVEKPAALSIEELLDNEERLEEVKNRVFVAYNRRFYASVQKVLKLIEEDGGLKSMHFEFTEWLHKIEPLKKAPGVKENWFFANSSHVVDLAFFIAGKPHDWKAYSQRGLCVWHPKTKFVGSGITESGIPFSYHSNWESAGRWLLELNTLKRKIILKPLEEVHTQLKGSVALERCHFDLSSEQEFKPGLLMQSKAFLLSEGSSHLCTLNTHIDLSSNVYKLMLE